MLARALLSIVPEGFGDSFGSPSSDLCGASSAPAAPDTPRLPSFVPPGVPGLCPQSREGRAGEEPGRQPLPVPLPAEGNDSP